MVRVVFLLLSLIKVITLIVCKPSRTKGLAIHLVFLNAVSLPATVLELRQINKR